MTNSIKFSSQELSDQWFIMETAMLECSIQEKLDLSDIRIYTSNQVGVYYIVSQKKDKNNKPEKVWFKKDFR